MYKHHIVIIENGVNNMGIYIYIYWVSGKKPLLLKVYLVEMPEVPVGIDLGTTNSCAFFYGTNQNFFCVEYPGGRKLYPSFVRYS